MDFPRLPRTLLLCFALVATSMCGGPPASREVADRFTRLYYDQANVAEAVKLCTGPARTRLEGELAAIKGVAPDSGANKPAVTVRLTSEDVSSTARATYVYNVDPRTSGVGPLVATLAVVNEGGQWLVSTFDERERSS
jgi:hypothetical protein